MLSTHVLGKKPTETLRCIARYYIDTNSNGKRLTKKDLKMKLNTYLIQCDSNISLPKWDKSVSYAIDRAMKKNSVHIEHIPIYDTELDKIKKIESKQIRRLAFTLLCLAKYWDVVNQTNTHWVNTQDNEIMKMANIRRSIAEQSEMYHKLEQLGYIEFSKKVDNTNVRVCFVSKGDELLRISDFRNLGYQYEKFRGVKHNTCSNCGLVFHARSSGIGRPLKYCRECAEKVWLQQRIDAVMRHRQRVKQQSEEDAKSGNVVKK